MAFLLTSAPTTDRSSWPRPCRNGSRWPAPRPLTSSGAVLGRTATSRASTRAFATSCSTAKFSTRSERPESSSRAIERRGSKMTGSPAAQTDGNGRGMLMRFLVLGGSLLASPGMAIAQDPLPYKSLKAYIVDLKASIQQRAGAGTNAFIAPPANQLDGFRLTMQQLLLGDVASAINGLDALNYDLNSLNDDSGKSYLVAQ